MRHRDTHILHTIRYIKYSLVQGLSQKLIRSKGADMTHPTLLPFILPFILIDITVRYDMNISLSVHLFYISTSTYYQSLCIDAAMRAST
jgi:hypothetical protein